MDITRVELSKIQADIGDHRYRVARLLEDVDALRRSVVELGVATLTGRTRGVARLVHVANPLPDDVAMGQVAAHFECGPSVARPRVSTTVPTGDDRSSIRTQRLLAEISPLNG